MSRRSAEIKLTETEANALQNIVQTSPDSPLARRAQVILECANGKSNKDISVIVGFSENDVGKWRKRYLAEGIDGLQSKHGGGTRRPDIDDDEVTSKLSKLLALPDKEWTVEELVAETHFTPHIVGAALRRMNINLERQRRWSITTNDELVAKTVDVVGLYVTRKEQAMIVCTSRTPMKSGQGVFVTRNRLLADDFKGHDGEVTLSDVIHTALWHVNDTSRLTPTTLSDFLEEALRNYPQDDSCEYHIFINSSNRNAYRGNRLKGLYIFQATDSERWLELTESYIHNMGDWSKLDAVNQLTESVRTYLDRCTDSTSPLIWMKRILFQDSEHSSEGSEVRAAKQEQESVMIDTQEIKDQIKDLLKQSLPTRQADHNGVQCGFISFVYDDSDLDVSITLPDDTSTVEPASFDFESLEGVRKGATQVENAVLRTRNEAGAQAAEAMIDFIKKKTMQQA